MQFSASSNAVSILHNSRRVFWSHVKREQLPQVALNADDLSHDTCGDRAASDKKLAAAPGVPTANLDQMMAMAGLVATSIKQIKLP